MNKELQIFKNNEFGEIRTLKINDEPWFVGKDVAEILGYERADNAIRNHVDEEDKLTHQISASGQNRNMKVINESGLYSLILGSKLPSAKKFKRWVTAEVLPNIRKHGAYMTEDTIEKALTNPDFLIQLATNLKEEQEKRKLAEKQVKQKQIVIDKVIDDKGLFTIGVVGKALKPYCPKMGARKVFEYLRQEQILMNAPNTQRHNLPYDKYNKYFEMKYVDTVIGTQTKVYFNGKGVKWFLDRLVKEGKLMKEDRIEVENQL